MKTIEKDIGFIGCNECFNLSERFVLPVKAREVAEEEEGNKHFAITHKKEATFKVIIKGYILDNRTRRKTKKQRTFYMKKNKIPPLF